VSKYDGGSNNPTSPFYVTPTNKSIELSISNLDFDYSYYQIGVIKRTADDGSISGVDVLYPIPVISGSSFSTSFNYTGLDQQVQTTTTVEEIFAERQRLDKVVAHAQNDQRLFVANVENKSRDFSTYQQKASAVKTEWVKTPFNSYNTNGVRSSTYYMNDSSFTESEVYALGIVYVHADGTKSPVFHIPGRAPDTVTGYNPYLSAALDYTGTATDGKA